MIARADNENDNEITDELRRICSTYPAERQNLIALLQDIQGRFGYLSQPAVGMAAEAVGLSPNEVFGVATFFSQFRFQRPGRHCVKVCEGTACHVRGSSLLLENICRDLHLLPGQTTPDGELSIERVMCLGSCALAPAVVLDETVYGRVSQKKLDTLIGKHHGPANDTTTIAG
jgi:NADH:ubiquinone oxidoreductase subunit E